MTMAGWISLYLRGRHVSLRADTISETQQNKKTNKAR
jgi:hypothetical protein